MKLQPNEKIDLGLKNSKNTVIITDDGETIIRHYMSEDFSELENDVPAETIVQKEAILTIIGNMFWACQDLCENKLELDFKKLVTELLEGSLISPGMANTPSPF